MALAVPVVSGERSMAIGPTCEPSQHWPPPGVQRQSVSRVRHAGLPGGGHGVATVPTPPVGQSRVTPVELVVVQAIVARGPRSQVPATHLGHGWVWLPVR